MKSAEVLRFGGVQMDLRCSPVIIVRYEDSQTGADFVAMADAVAEAAKTRPLIGMIHDTTQLTRVIGATDRQLMRQAVDRLIPMLDAQAVGAAAIISNPIVRGAMTAAKWFMTQKYEEKVFGTAREGADWLVARFEEVGSPLPASTVARLTELVAERPERARVSRQR